MSRHDQQRSGWGKFFVKTSAAFAVVAGIGYSGAYVLSDYVKDNEAAIKIRAGQVVDTEVETGVKFDSLLPKVEYIKYPTTLQTTAVSATESDSFAVRTAERAQIYGEFKVKYTIDKTDPQFASIYTLQKAESLAGIEDDIQDYTIPAAIDIYKTVPTIAVNDNLTETGERIAERLQTILDDRGFSYVNIQDVVPTGMGLSPKANADLEQIVSEERKLALLDAQAATAAKAAEIVGAQTAVTTAAFDALREAGVPEDQLAQFYCLQLYRDSDKIGEQFAAGCIGPQEIAVGVAAPYTAAPVKAAPATP